MNYEKIIDEVHARLALIITEQMFSVDLTTTYNDRDVEVPAIKICYPGLNDIEIRTEALDKYFSIGLCIMSIAQRSEWINATREEKQICWDKGIHPAMYKKQ